MRCLVLLLTVFLSAVLFAGDSDAAPRKASFRFALTIDFMDMAFYDSAEGDSIYPLEKYESRIKEYAEAGIGKLYLRTPVGDAEDWKNFAADPDAGCRYLYPALMDLYIRTLNAYDPYAETIRLGHKYGMEVWLWEPLGDEGGYSYPDKPERDVAKTAPHWPYLGLPDFYFKHPEAMPMRDPRGKTWLSPEACEAITSAARKRTIGSIELNATGGKSVVPDWNKEHVRLFVSEDNVTYVPYDGHCKLTFGADSITIGELALKANYVKVVLVASVHSERYRLDEDSASRRVRHVVRDTEGAVIPAVWGWLNNGNSEKGTLLFFNRVPMWCRDHFAMGFKVGESSDAPDYLPGITEFTSPVGMEYRVKRMRRYAAYGFDGFMFNLRSHSWNNPKWPVGFNAEIRAEYLKRHGVDIWCSPDVDIARINAIRAEGIMEFVRRSKEAVGGRPIFISGPPPSEEYGWEEDGFKAMGSANFKDLPWNYAEYFAEGILDGVNMIGADFSDYFTAEVRGGRKVSVGVMREGSGHLHELRPKDYDFAKDMASLACNPAMDEAEIYESLELTNRPEKRQQLRAILDSPEFQKAEEARRRNAGH